MPLGSPGLAEYLTCPSFRDCEFLADLYYYHVSGTGLEVSPGRFFENGVIQSKVRHDLL